MPAVLDMELTHEHVAMNGTMCEGCCYLHVHKRDYICQFFNVELRAFYPFSRQMEVIWFRLCPQAAITGIIHWSDLHHLAGNEVSSTEKAMNFLEVCFFHIL